MPSNFVETATLRLVDDTSAKARRINSELRRLFTTANRFRAVEVKIQGLQQASQQVRRLTRDLEKLSAAARGRSGRSLVPTVTARSVAGIDQLNTALRHLAAVSAMPRVRFPTVSQTQITRLQAFTSALTQYAHVATSLPNVQLLAPPRMPRSGSAGRPSGLPPRFPLAPTQAQQNIFWGNRQDSNWAAAGRIMARSFVAAVGVNLHQAVSAAGRSGREGITSLDTALAVARASGVDAGCLP
ncbi:hypothetical protein ACFQU1_04885 [Chelatococcus sp. GCM10030263]|uniref:hypothetical protein n=1 Tax=Chelatococcus sp. GCM10030263 TaxID=3273387 RepID=UPI003613B24C